MVQQIRPGKWIPVVVLALMGSLGADAQQRPNPANAKPGTAPAPAAATPTPPKPSGPKPYKEVITSKAVSDDGLLTVHKVEDKYYFEIPDKVLGRDILVVNRLSKAAAGMRNFFFGYAGDKIGDNVIRFEKGPNNKVFLRLISYDEMAGDSTASMFKAVANSNIQPIAQSFDIAAFGADSTGVVLDVTSFLNSDNEILNFEASAKRTFRVGNYQADKSYISGVKSFPINTEIKTVKTYGRSAGATPGQPPAAMTPPSGSYTVEINSSMMLLPEKPMQPRYYDERIGFFTRRYVDFEKNPQGVESVSMVTRWRLEPKDEDVEKYKRGELVEPKKPIIFYIDPATPKKWVPYLIQGVNDWQAAFEKAGFKNAIFVKEAPVNDPEWSLEDARYSAIVYKPSDVPNASGPHEHDPRSGEILESHINWYHNVMELLRNWYFVQASPNDPRARAPKFDDKLMGELIRFVSSHEVGHTLGLRHNFGSSSSTPVEKLRDKKWLEENGHTPSIMDYARFNYVAQPEDNVGEKGLFPRIGDYDKWAIEWGYKWYPQAKSAEEETPILNALTIERLKDKRLWFGRETNPDDPRSQNEDLGDNSMKASTYGIKNLQRIIPNLQAWTKEPNENYETLSTLYNEVVTQFNRYVGHVSKNVGGVMETPKTVEQAGAVYEIVSREQQKEAMDFLNKQVFTTPTWLLDQQIFAKTGNNGTAVVNRLQDAALGRLLSAGTINKLLNAEATLGTKTYTLNDMMTDLRRSIFTELPTRKPIDIYRRNLQKNMVERLLTFLKPATAPASLGGGITISFGPTISRNSDALSYARGTLRSLQTEIRTALPSYTDTATRYHLQDLLDRINDGLTVK
ncbi:zinc-dependent metalloprotease [Flavihumibacter cheonanensis]|uniref:zinc-dependent metalloprotease n=1 Tax=Flavihumibacter cheonanensis TaxID=1442385 RepID=UPI001EF93730|nr:zinc-dependent metalloprotease [Flavihumibacter cheonanensis]MCG7754321.1 zinc-dependent metalloprotease [Flavihumibacter cheonanensis]